MITAIVGTGNQNYENTLSVGCIVMKEGRPTTAGNWIAQADGTWFDDQSSIREAEIYSRLSEIDSESLRPLRAISNGSTDQYDIDKIATLDAEAEALRAELKTLEV